MRWLELCLAIAALAAAAGCAEPALETQSVVFDALELQLPAGWQSRDATRPRTRLATWTLDGSAQRESIAIAYTAPLPAVAAAGTETVRRLLEEAQRGLASAAFDGPAVFRSPMRLPGVRMTGTFIPPGATRPYRRTHAVLIDGDRLVHVIFTSSDPDASHQPFELALATLHRKEA